jgi:hypothetical protein
MLTKEASCGESIRPITGQASSTKARIGEITTPVLHSTSRCFLRQHDSARPLAGMFGGITAHPPGCGFASYAFSNFYWTT